ncbi:MAG: hypothetical protein IT290_09750 [Deltaproteobacteria bacterium]|nr:hypothetical protein [Deltaproteobacteria bacterium]
MSFSEHQAEGEDLVSREKRASLVVAEQFRDALTPERLHAIYRRLRGEELDLGDGARWMPISDAGRGTIIRLEVNGCAFFVRQFLRGGFMAKLTRTKFFKSPRSHITRPIVEFDILRRLEGLSVPVPAAAYTRESFGGLCYQGFLATQAIPNAGNFLVALRESRDANRNEFIKIARDAGRVASRILLGGVMHGDLHVGNVVFQSDARAWIVDFDKAYWITNPAQLNSLREQLYQRWDRSIRKHGLPAGLTEAFAQGLEDPNI